MNLARMRQIIRRPILSEKSAVKGEQGIMCLQVAKDATKIDVRRAVETLFGVKVDSVRTMTVHGKSRRFRLTASKRPDWKKAYIVLRKGEKPVRFEDFVVEEKA